MNALPHTSPSPSHWTNHGEASFYATKFLQANGEFLTSAPAPPVQAAVSGANTLHGITPETVPGMDGAYRTSFRRF